uniref:DNA primase n=1 Tax=Sandarakinorhabdus sp. TaxID=1916663 RepID=UPI00286E0107
AHGDVIRFLTDAEGLPFMDAVKQLAAQAGMEVPENSPQDRQRAEVNDSLSALTARAAQFYVDQLAGPLGGAARAYLDKRGLSQAVITAFGLGFAPDGGALRKHMKDVETEKLVEAGLIGRSEDGDIYDRFRGRLMFPIRDRRGRVIGFGGRALGDAQPKYLNSADGPLFDKGRILYNLDKAGPAGRKANRLVIVEGYMDVIGVAQAGIAELAAPLGTALTEAQLGLAWRVADEPILCFDGDAAGQRAALRAATRALPLLAPGKSLRIATLPGGEDPDDLVRRGGPAAFEAVLANAVPLVDHLWLTETAGMDAATPERRAAARQRLKDHAGTIADPSIRALYAADFAARFDAAYLARPQREWQPQVRTQGRKQGSAMGARWQPPIMGASPALKASASAGTDPQAMAILAGLLTWPELADTYGDIIASLPLADGDNARLRDGLLAILADDPGLETASLDDHLLSGDLMVLATGIRRGNALAFSFTRRDGDFAAASRDFGMMVGTAAARLRITAELAAATQRFQTTLSEADFEAQQSLRAEQNEIEATMMRLAESLREG